MERRGLCLVVLVAMAITSVSGAPAPVYVQPEQVHIAYGDDPTQMYVVWSTASDTNMSMVRYFPVGSSKVMYATGVTRLFTDGGSLRRSQYIHRVKVTGLIPGQKYKYDCGSDDGWSGQFSFTTMKDGNQWSPRFALYGDLGKINAQSLVRLQQDTLQGMYDAVLHVGDFAYDMDTDNAKYGDEFLKQIEPIAANIPYMTCPGNHEMQYNFSNYRHRFVMPGDELGDKMFYSINMGPVHFISFNTEYYFYLYYGIIQPIEQYRWLEKDLKEANKPENRAKHPWIITMAHRPMYCSNKNKDDCTKQESLIRTGVPFFHILGLEDMFYEYGVDLALWAHEHSYERLWPVYDRKVYNGSLKEPYTNPGAPVHIITGSAGCQENHDNFTVNTAPWSAFRSDDYGYSRLTVFNSTHLYLEQVSDDQGGKIIDKVWVKKDKHGSYKDTKLRAPDHDRFNRIGRKNKKHVISMGQK